MRRIFVVATATLAIGIGGAKAQTDLTAYTDANGYLNVQALTCAQLANTWQQDADLLMTWYSGWYNGLAKKHYFIPRAPSGLNTKSSCTARPIRESGSLMPSLSF